MKWKSKAQANTCKCTYTCTHAHLSRSLPSLSLSLSLSLSEDAVRRRRSKTRAWARGPRQGARGRRTARARMRQETHESVNQKIYALLLGNEKRGLLGNERRGSPAAAFRSAFAAEARWQRLRNHEHGEFSTRAAGEMERRRKKTEQNAGMGSCATHIHTRTHTHTKTHTCACMSSGHGACRKAQMRCSRAQSQLPTAGRGGGRWPPPGRASR